MIVATVACTTRVVNDAFKSVNGASKSINNASKSIYNASKSIIEDSRVMLQIVVSLTIEQHVLDTNAGKQLS
jgi:hypothetical protein